MNTKNLLGLTLEEAENEFKSRNIQNYKTVLTSSPKKNENAKIKRIVKCIKVDEAVIREDNCTSAYPLHEELQQKESCIKSSDKKKSYILFYSLFLWEQLWFRSRIII